jgi:hypothetical protein
VPCVIVREVQRAQRVISGSLSEDGQAWDAFKVPAIVGDQWYCVSNSAGGDPQVVIAREPVRAARGLQAALDHRISLTDLKIVRDDSHGSNPFLEKPHLRGSPFSPLGPIVKLPHSYEGNHYRLVLDVRPVQAGSRIIPAQEIRENVSIKEDFIHVVPG